jgi:hypothetical protein
VPTMPQRPRRVVWRASRPSGSGSELFIIIFPKFTLNTSAASPGGLSRQLEIYRFHDVKIVSLLDSPRCDIRWRDGLNRACGSRGRYKFASRS